MLSFYLVLFPCLENDLDAMDPTQQCDDMLEDDEARVYYQPGYFCFSLLCGANNHMHLAPLV
jgi:hypothetical protein